MYKYQQTPKNIEQLDKFINKNKKESIITNFTAMGSSILTFTIPNQLTYNIFLGTLFYMIYKDIKTFKYLTNFKKYYKNSKEYIELDKSYKIVLEEILNLFEKLEWDTDTKIYTGYNYMLKNGYFSYDKTFNKIDNDSWCMYLFGTNIMTGQGDTRHMSAMLTDLLQMSGYYAYNVSMISDQYSELEESYKDDFLNTLIKAINYLQVQISKLNFDDNYTIPAVTIGGHSYLMDLNIERLLPIDEDLKFSFGSKTYSLFCHPNLNDGIFDKIILFPTQPELLDIRKEELFEVKRMCKDCTDIFEKFYRAHKELYKEIIYKRRILIRECSNSTNFKEIVKIK